MRSTDATPIFERRSKVDRQPAAETSFPPNFESHLTGALETATLPRLPNHQLSDLKDRAFRVLRKDMRRYVRPTISWELAPDLCEALVSARLYLREAYNELGIKRTLPEVMPYVFSTRLTAVSGLGNPRTRILGLSEGLQSDLPPELQKIQLYALTVHELAHACGALRIVPSKRDENGVHFVGQGWLVRGLHRNLSHSNYFQIFEEGAASHFDRGYWTSRGGRIQQHNFVQNIPATTEDPIIIKLYRLALAVQHPAEYAKLKRTLRNRSWPDVLAGRKPIVLSVPALIVHIGENRAEDLYCHTMSALDMLAPEVYPERAPEYARQSFRRDIMRVQADGEHHRIVSRLRSAFGSDGLRFLASVRYGTVALELSETLLMLFAQAAQLPESQKREVRADLRELQREYYGTYHAFKRLRR